MCYDDNARPPIPPGADGEAHGEDLILTTPDGNRSAAYIARPDEARATGAQIIIYPDIRGLHQFYKELALRFAEIGITAVAIDYFSRTAGLSPRNDEFDFIPHFQQLEFSNLMADARAALATLESGKPTFTIGFCLGGSLSILSSAEELGLAGAISFYGGLARQLNGSDDTVLNKATQAHNPVLGLYGGADQGIPAEQVQALDENLDQAGVDHLVTLYENAPHSFFDRRATEYAAASSDAWAKVQAFIQKYSA